MGAEMALGRLMCRGLLQEHNPVTAVPSSCLASQTLELVAYTTDTSKGAEEGFRLSSEGNISHFSFPLTPPKVFLQGRLPTGQLFLSLSFAHSSPFLLFGFSHRPQRRLLSASLPDTLISQACKKGGRCVTAETGPECWCRDASPALLLTHASPGARGTCVLVLRSLASVVGFASLF